VLRITSPTSHVLKITSPTSHVNTISFVFHGHNTSNPNQLGIYHNFVAQAHAHAKTIADQVQTKAHFNQVFIPSVKI
jgi:hypothetical protein